MQVLAIIPSRLGSTRLPNKPLADINGKPMVQWVYERAKAARRVHRVVVATDSAEVGEAVRRFGGEFVMTRPDHQSGTDRMAEAVRLEKTRPDVVVNVQGDEPMMDPSAIDAAVELIQSGTFEMATVVSPLRTAEEMTNPSIVKALVDKNGRAIYFSRFGIPFSRIDRPEELSTGFDPFLPARHVGLYAFKTETLIRFAGFSPTELEKGESLEQLRALYHGISIGVARTDKVFQGIDTPEDLELVRKALGHAP